MSQRNGLIYHNYDGKKEPRTSGVCCELSFQNPDVKAAFEKMFALKSTERLVSVEVSSIGVKAYFEGK